MTKLFTDPARFNEHMLVGFLDANSAYVAGVPGGMVRAHTTRPGKVAVVIGGGSGHYPAFCGTVGPGFVDGAVVGNIFTSQGSVPTAAGKEWAAKAGGTSGVLWGAMLSALGVRLGDTGRPDSASIAAGMRDGYDALIQLGGASRGDKTMLDALLPFIEELERRVADGEPWQQAWRAAADVATRTTADMRPKVGRARTLAERSVGTPDAGATSLGMCAHTVADSFTLIAKGESE